MPVPHSLQSTPIEGLISSAWRRISSRLGTTNIDEDNFLLFTIWMIDNLCEVDAHETDPTDFYDNAYDAIRQFLKNRNITAVGNDIEHLTESLLDVQYYLWGLILRSSESLSVDVINVYSLLDKSIGKRRKESLELSESFRFKGTEELRAWLTEYIESDTALTASETIDWNQEELVAQATALVTANKPNTAPQNIINIYGAPLNIDGGAQIGLVIENADKIKKQ